MKTHANPPSHCDLCKQPITTEFSDVRLPTHQNVWANVCPTCAKRYRVTYGTGRGQRWARRPEDLSEGTIPSRFYKVEG